jgi:predicted nucleic acid-binding protein
MIVADSSPLIYLSRSGRLGLLKELYGEVLATTGVAGETMAEGRPGVAELKEAVDRGWLRIESAEPGFDPESEGITVTDAEVITLAEMKDSVLLTNDRALFHCARARGVRCRWLTMAIVEAVRGRKLIPEEAEDALTDMIRAGLRVESGVLAELLTRIRKAASE